jgi:hypothetical protein
LLRLQEAKRQELGGGDACADEAAALKERTTGKMVIHKKQNNKTVFFTD